MTNFSEAKVRQYAFAVDRLGDKIKFASHNPIFEKPAQESLSVVDGRWHRRGQHRGPRGLGTAIFRPIGNADVIEKALAVTAVWNRWIGLEPSPLARFGRCFRQTDTRRVEGWP